MAGEGAHPRDELGRFASAGGAAHASKARREARKATRRAQDASEGASTKGEHQDAARAHQGAAEAHRAAAAAHGRAAEGKDGRHDLDHRGASRAQANQHEHQAAKHDQAAAHHGEQARTAPREGGAAAWAAEKLKGLSGSLERAKEGVERGGEAAGRAEQQALEGDPLKGIMGAGGALASRIAVPGAGLVRGVEMAGRVGSGVVGGEREGHAG